MTTHVFLGPSLALDEARAILPDAAYHGPVQMGDVQALVGRATTIVIVDGYFERVPAVWHKEILFALSRGVRVIGASSMGALRAAELHAFGMEGVGRVFEAYRDGAIEDDDEVALVHGPAEDGYVHLSEPLANIRFALADAVRDGVITSGEAERLVARSRARFYPERSWPRVLADDAPPALRDWLARTRPDAKRDDARLALAAVAAARPAPVPFDFEATVFWHRLVATTARASADAAAPMSADVLRHARVALDDLREVSRLALVEALIPLEADRLGITVSPSEIAAAGEALRRERGLVTAAATRAWLDEQGLDDRAFTELARRDALLDKLLEHHEPFLRRDQTMAAVLRRQGRFAALAAAAAGKRRALAEAHGEAEVGDAELVAWHERRLGPLAGSLDAHAKRRGFASRFELLEELVASFLADQS